MHQESRVDGARNFGFVEHDGEWLVTALLDGDIEGRTVAVCPDRTTAVVVVNALLSRYAPDKISYRAA